MKYLATLLCGFLLLIKSEAAVYYLSPTGSDNAAGSAGAPWLTLVKFCTNYVAGDVLFVHGGLYDCFTTANQFFSPNYYSVGAQGTSLNPVIISNYPGEVPIFANAEIPGGATPHAPIDLGQCAWIKVFGLTISNCNVGCVTLNQLVTNCEVGYCTLGPSATNTRGWVFGAGVGTPGDAILSNYVHDCVMYGAWSYSVPTNQIESGDVCSIGPANWQGSIVTNIYGWNAYVNNTIYHGGHTAFNPQGATYDYYAGNKVHNEVWISWPEFGQLGGHRSVGAFAGYCVFDSNDFSYAGNPLANAGAEGLGIFGQNNIIRRNIIRGNEFVGMDFYDKAVGGGWAVTNNHAYHNTLAHNSLGQLWQTNYGDTWQPGSTAGATTSFPSVSGPLDKQVIFFAGSSGSVLVNNLIAFNGGGQVAGQATNYVANRGGSDLTAMNYTNWFNDQTGDPKFVNDTNTTYFWPTLAGNPFDTNAFGEFALSPNSPCIDTGTWLTTASGSSSGTSMTVADPWFFWQGMTAAGHVFAGDKIQLQGQTTTSTITAINYSTGVLTLNSSLTWTNGQGVALAYNGAAPDFGAIEYSGATNITGIAGLNITIGQGVNTTITLGVNITIGQQ